MPETDRVKEELEARLKFLTEQMEDLEGTLRSPHSADSEERATEREADEVLESLERGTFKEINQIKAALSRIEDGTYGWCDRCGEPIGEARQKALIYATQCIRCAEAVGR